MYGRHDQMKTLSPGSQYGASRDDAMNTSLPVTGRLCSGCIIHSITTLLGAVSSPAITERRREKTRCKRTRKIDIDFVITSGGDGGSKGVICSHLSRLVTTRSRRATFHHFYCRSAGRSSREYGSATDAAQPPLEIMRQPRLKSATCLPCRSSRRVLYLTTKHRNGLCRLSVSRDHAPATLWTCIAHRSSLASAINIVI